MQLSVSFSLANAMNFLGTVSGVLSYCLFHSDCIGILSLIGHLIDPTRFLNPRHVHYEERRGNDLVADHATNIQILT